MRYLVMILAVFILAGCATHEDPRQGGLFGYNPAAYEKRQNALKEKIEAEEARKAVLLERQKKLVSEVQSKKKKQLNLKKELGSMSKDISLLERHLIRQRATTAQALEKRHELIKQIKALKYQVAEIEKKKQSELGDLNGKSSKAMQAEITRLKSKLAFLLEEGASFE